MGAARKGQQQTQTSSKYRASPRTLSRMRVRPSVDSCVLNAPSTRWMTCSAKVNMAEKLKRQKNMDGKRSKPIREEAEAIFVALSPSREKLDALKRPRTCTLLLRRGCCDFLKAVCTCILRPEMHL
eukprot:5456622-Pleurochrysis_carterae.AAC.2